MKLITQTEFDDILARVLAVADEPVQELLIELQDIDLTAPGLTAPATTPEATETMPAPRTSQRITIRIPGPIVAAFRAQALKTRVPYQRLMNRALASAARAFV